MLLTRAESTQRIKGFLHEFPVAFRLARWAYRLFRGPDLTIQERIVKAIGKKREAFFIQVGSNDGLQGDPIHDLILDHKDWRGIFMEPVDFLFERLRKNYQNDERFVFENVAIGSRKEAKRFYFVSEQAKDELDLPFWYDQLGSFNRSHILESLGNEVDSYIVDSEITCVRLQDVLDRNRVTSIDLIHIDTEGFDYEVLSQIDLVRYKPTIILYEHKLLGEDQFKRARSLLQSAGYRLFEYGGDTLAVRMSHR